MQIKVGVKLWFAFFVTLTLCVLTLYLLLHNSLKQGFLDYTSQQAVQRLEILRSSLLHIYTEEGSFVQLQQDPRRWLNLKSTIFAESDSQFADLAKSRPMPVEDTDSPQRFYREFVSSITLYDAAKKLLLGLEEQPEQPLSWVPIDYGNKIIGFIGFVKPDVVTRDADKEFMQHQWKVFSIISLLVLAISTVVATFLSHRISRPLTLLAENVQALASGDYGRQMRVNSKDEIGQLCNNFNLLAQTLAANEKSRALWIADISHEMLTPVSVIKARIEAMQDGIRPLDQDNLALLHHKTEGLHTLVGDLFELSLSDIGALAYTRQKLLLAPLLKVCIEQFQAKAQAAGLALVDLVEDNEASYTLGDAKRLEQLFSNLLENSIRYTAAGGRIEIRLKVQHAKVDITIDDTAPGVPDEQQEKIFERLYRLEASRNRSTGGAGLGLAICRNIVAAHQGSIVAGSSTLGGLAVRITLPQIA